MTKLNEKPIFIAEFFEALQKGNKDHREQVRLYNLQYPPDMEILTTIDGDPAHIGLWLHTDRSISYCTKANNGYYDPRRNTYLGADLVNAILSLIRISRD